MVPTPDIPCWTDECDDASHLAQMRTALAALIIFLVCVFVIGARF